MSVQSCTQSLPDFWYEVDAHLDPFDLSWYDHVCLDHLLCESYAKQGIEANAFWPSIDVTCGP